MTKTQLAQTIQAILDEHFPNPAIPLKFSNTYTFLIAVLLSAQCTDERVNQVTPKLFENVKSPQRMLTRSVEEIQKIIQPCGLSASKSRYIWKLSQILIDQYESEVPCSFEALESLPGVGHKTASVVMAQMFDVPAFPVDTHIHRLAKRWGLSSGKNVVQTERDLKKVFPKKNWNKLHLQIIYFGRKFCPARGHNENECPICKLLKKKS
ncbi:MAG: Endonuclease III [Chlamydiae bacterium]|nr:Endonuclease III [Chlamydiota bacterium]